MIRQKKSLLCACFFVLITMPGKMPESWLPSNITFLKDFCGGACFAQELSTSEQEDLARNPSFQEFSKVFDQVVQTPPAQNLDPNADSPVDLTEFSLIDSENATPASQNSPAVPISVPQPNEPSGASDVLALPGTSETQSQKALTTSEPQKGEMELLPNQVLTNQTLSNQAGLATDSLLTQSQGNGSLAKDLFQAEQQRLRTIYQKAVLNSFVVGYRAASSRRDSDGAYETAPGPKVLSGDIWHLAIDGPFFFRVKNLQTGESFYTRAGDFELSGAGTLELVRGEVHYELDPPVSLPSQIVMTSDLRAQEVLGPGESPAPLDTSGLDTSGIGSAEALPDGMEVSAQMIDELGDSSAVRVMRDGTILRFPLDEWLNSEEMSQLKPHEVTQVKKRQEVLGQIPLFYFKNSARLTSRDGVFFQPTPRSGYPQKVALGLNSSFGILSGSLEFSNAPLEQIEKTLLRIEACVRP